MDGVDPLTASVLDSAAEGALLLDADHRVLHANAAALALLERTGAELTGEVLDLPLPPTSAGERWTPLDGASPPPVELEVLTSVVGVEPARVVVWLRPRTAGGREEVALLDELESLTDVGRWIWHPQTDATSWSANFHQIFGLVPGSVVPTADLVLDALHPLDQARVRAVVGELAARGAMDPTRMRIVRSDGEVRTLVVTQLVAEQDAEGRPDRVEGWVQDVTRLAAEERLARASRGARMVLRRWLSTEEDAPALLAAVGEALEVAFAVLWMPRQTLLHAVATWASPAFDVGSLDREVRRARLPRGTGYAGRAWATGRVVTARDVPEVERTRAAGQAVAAGLRGGCAVPARTDHHVVAVLSVHTSEERELGPEDVAGLDRIGGELALEVEAARRGRSRELSPRELDVLRAISEGRSTEEIASDLGIRPATVRTHVEHLLAKLGARDRAAAVATALRAGMIA